MAIHEVRVGYKEGIPDVKGQGVFDEAQRTIGVPLLENVRTTRVYRLEGITKEQAKHLAEKLFCDQIVQEYTLNEPLITDTQNKLEVSLNPGVMNPEAASILKSAKDLGIDLLAADSSTEYGFYGGVGKEEVGEVVNRLLVNKTVERIVEEKPQTLLITGEVGPINTIPIKDANPDQLMELSRDKLFLDLSEMQAIQNYFRQLDRNPTDCELEIIAARWSEHCGHKTFKSIVEVAPGVLKPPLFERITTTAKKYFEDEVVSAFNDNAGGARFFEGTAIAGKVETHISPSAIEPFGGAGTGEGGVVRDQMGFGKGAKVISSTNMFGVARPDLDPSMLPEGTLPPDYILRKVIAGVGDYGNKMGIPTNNGSLHFHEDFRAKPTVIVGAYGIIPEEYAQKGVPQVDDLVVTVGGRTGRDGIHGATFSSGEMTERTISVNSTAVQIGNAIEEKRMADALLDARDRGLIRAITDCGAAGFSSAVGEMAEDIGVTVDVSKAPLKYPGLSPWEIFLSESQERMITAISPDNIEEFEEICRKYNVESAVLGKFDGSNRLKVTYKEEVVADLDYEFLKHGMPEKVMIARYEKPVFEEEEIEAPKNRDEWVDTIKKVLSHGNVCSKEPIVRRYDHSVQGSGSLSPYSGVKYDGPNDATIVTPILDKPYGVVISHGINPILNRIDPYWGGVWATTEGMANYVAVGGDPEKAMLINNYIWPYPDEESMGSLDLAVDAVVDCMDAYERPVISGKDSLSSTYRGKDGQVIKIPPGLCISVFGKIPDVEQTVTSDIKKPNSTLYLVGKQDQNMGGSTYFDINGQVGNEVPKVDLEVTPKVFKGIHKAIKSGKVLSCHDVSEGGVIGAVSEMCFGGDCGVDLELDPEIESPDKFLFNETAGTFIVEVEDNQTAERLFKDLPFRRLGKTKEEKEISASRNGSRLFTGSTDEFKEAWQRPMKEIFH